MNFTLQRNEVPKYLGVKEFHTLHAQSFYIFIHGTAEQTSRKIKLFVWGKKVSKLLRSYYIWLWSVFKLKPAPFAQFSLNIKQTWTNFKALLSYCFSCFPLCLFEIMESFRRRKMESVFLFFFDWMTDFWDFWKISNVKLSEKYS